MEEAACHKVRTPGRSKGLNRKNQFVFSKNTIPVEGVLMTSESASRETISKLSVTGEWVKELEAEGRKRPHIKNIYLEIISNSPRP